MSIKTLLIRSIQRVERKLLTSCNKLSSARRVANKLRNYAAALDPKGQPQRFHTDALSDFLKLLVSSGFEPSHVVDIGANRGNWTREVRQYFPQAQYTLFEPQVNLKQAMSDLLADSLVTLNSIGVGNKSSELLFTIHERDDSCSFALTEEQASTRGFKQVKVPVVTLDAHIAANNLEWPDFIKIDAEGFDLEVINGASKSLGKATLVLVECAVCNPSIQNTALAVIEAMDSRGFRPLDFTDLNRPWPNRVLWLTEIAFVKKGSKLDVTTSQKD